MTILMRAELALMDTDLKRTSATGIAGFSSTHRFFSNQICKG